jgi:ABC-2 type transport system ATP-binding protein
MTILKMIRVQNLTKRYPGVTAVDGISFTVDSGQIVGFLGPNGAGKTTTMRILTGYMPATSGSVRVAGFDVREQSLEVRRRIGYLPENNPLYPEMRVREYLLYRARLKGVPARELWERLSEVVEMCGLKDVTRKIIGQLSKGYRQRVGLADALIHEPELLILDEPTIGLDPSQIHQVRELIKNLARHHTLLLSTHLLPEVEMTCDSVIILNRGRIICSDKIGNLTRRGALRVEARGPREEVTAALQQLPAVTNIKTKQDGDYVVCQIETGGTDARDQIFEVTSARGWALRELTQERLSLEEIFMKAVASDSEDFEE